MNTYGIEYELADAIREAVKAQHPVASLQVGICVCGARDSGAVQPLACRALKKLLERSKTLAELEEP